MSMSFISFASKLRSPVTGAYSSTRSCVLATVRELETSVCSNIGWSEVLACLPNGCDGNGDDKEQRKLENQLAFCRASVAGKYASSGGSTKQVKNKKAVVANKVPAPSKAKKMATTIDLEQSVSTSGKGSENAAGTITAGLLRFLKSQNASPHMVSKYEDVIQRVEQIIAAKVNLEEELGQQGDEVGQQVEFRHMLLPLETGDIEMMAPCYNTDEPLPSGSSNEEVEDTNISGGNKELAENTDKTEFDKFLRDKLENFPFEGNTVVDVGKREHSDHVNIKLEPRNAEMQRQYKVQGKDASWSLPAVTDILNSTVGEKRRKLLLGWEHREVKKHGKAKHKALVSSTLDFGSLFHENVESVLKDIAAKEGNTSLVKSINFSEVKSSEQLSSPKSTLRKLKKSITKKTYPTSSQSPIRGESAVTGKSSAPSISVKLENVIPPSADINSTVMPSMTVKLDNLLPADSSRPSTVTVKLENLSSSGSVISTATPTTFDGEGLPVSFNANTEQLSSSSLHTSDVHPDCHMPASYSEGFITEYQEYPGIIGSGSSEEERHSHDVRSDYATPTITAGSSLSKDVDWTDSEKEEMKGWPEHLMQSVQHVLDAISGVRALETRVAHMELGYAGTFDCVAKYKGKLYMIDWKTSAKKKRTIEECYDYPLQLVAYAGAVNHNPHLFDFKIEQVLIVIAYKDGSLADVHEVDNVTCKQLWPKWIQRLHQYHGMFSEDLSEVVS